MRDCRDEAGPDVSELRGRSVEQHTCGVTDGESDGAAVELAQHDLRQRDRLDDATVDGEVAQSGVRSSREHERRKAGGEHNETSRSRKHEVIVGVGG